MAPRVMLASLVFLLASCGGLGAGPQIETPTAIDGSLEASGVAGMPIYAGSDTPYAHALTYATTVRPDGTFHFELTDNPPVNRTDSCFTGTLIYAAWGTWGVPPAGSGDEGAYFAFAVLNRAAGTGQTEYVVWVHTPEPQVLPYDCDHPEAGISLPVGWSTVLYGESPEGFIKRASIPADAEWETRTLCFFQCAP